MVCLELRDLVVGPAMESVALDRALLDACCRVGAQPAALDRKLAERAQRREPTTGGVRRLGVKQRLDPFRADSNIGRSAMRSAQENVERLRQVRSNTTAPNSAELAKTCRALAIKAHPTQRAGSRTAYAQAQRDYFQECVAKRSQKLA